MRSFRDQNIRQAVGKRRDSSEEAGAITEARIRDLLVGYARAVMGSEQRWKHLRIELIQKVNSGLRGRE